MVHTQFYQDTDDPLPNTIADPQSCVPFSLANSYGDVDPRNPSRYPPDTIGYSVPMLENATTTTMPLVHHAHASREVQTMHVVKTSASVPVATTLAVKELNAGSYNEANVSTASQGQYHQNGRGGGVFLSREDMERYEKAFRLFDHDGEGYITCGELGRVMRSLGMDPTVDELHYMISVADINRTGTVEFEEFVYMMKEYIEKHHQEEDEDALLRKVFQVFDRTNDGYISGPELKAVMKQLGEELTEEELNSMLNLADTNGDGTVTFEEFRRICAADISKIPVL